MIDRGHRLPLSRQAALLGISRGSLYYSACPVSAAELRSCGGSTSSPRLSVRGQPDAADLLRGEGIAIGREQVTTMMRRMAIEAVIAGPIRRTAAYGMLATKTTVVDVHTQVSGTIQQIGFIEGQTVHKGSLIAQLDPRPYQAALQEAEANLARNEAQLTNAQVNLNRYTPLRISRVSFVSAPASSQPSRLWHTAAAALRSIVWGRLNGGACCLWQRQTRRANHTASARQHSCVVGGADTARSLFRRRSAPMRCAEIDRECCVRPVCQGAEERRPGRGGNC